MSFRAALLTALLVAGSVLVAPPAAAQTTPDVSVDVSVWKIELSRDPVVDVPLRVTAFVNSTDAVVVRVNFKWGDDSDLRPGQVGGTSSWVAGSFEDYDTKPFSLDIQPPVGRAGPQDIKVEVQVQGKSDVDPSNNTRVLNTFVRIPKLNVTWDGPLVNEVAPQGEAYLRYFVRNDGNYVDNATPLVEPDAGGAWLVDTYGRIPPAEPGKSVTGFLLLRSTSSTDLRNFTGNLTVRSGIGPAGNVRLPIPNMSVNDSLYSRRPLAAVEGLPPTVQAFAGENRSIEFILRNLAPHDQLFRVAPRLEHDPVGWEATMQNASGWPANVSFPANATNLYPVPLRANESLAVRVNVTRAADAPNSTALLILEVNSTDGDRIGQLASVNLRTLATTTVTDAGVDLTPSLVGFPTLVYQGDPVGVRVEVRNAGRVNSSNATLHLELRDNLRTVEETDLRVPPIEAGGSATLAWSPSTTGLRGAYVVLGRVLANASQVDRNPVNDTLRQDLHVRAPIVNVRAPEALRAVPGGRLVLSSATGGFSVENLGDREETFLVRLDSPVEWLRGEWRVFAPPGTIQPVAVQLDVPGLPGVRQVAATFSARIEDRPRFSASTTLQVEIDDVEPPRVSVLAPLTEGRVGVETRLALQAQDASGIRRVEVLMRTPAGDRVVLPLQREVPDGDVYATRHTPFQPGAYLLEFRVEDGSDAGLPPTAINVTWEVRGSSYQGFKPVNFGEGAHVGRTPLRFAEAVPDTTKSLLVDAGDGFRPLAPPYQVTLPLFEGPRTVLLRAVAKDGTPWEGRWNVTVDLTPPQVAEPVTRDAGSGRIDLSVRAEGAKEVVARFQTDTGPVEVGLAGRGGGLFGATATAPASWSSVTFIAKDDAGNEGSAVVEAPKKGAPGFEAALLVLALAAALALARRRTR